MRILSAYSGKLILKMSSEHQTVDHANMGNDPVMISSSHDTAKRQVLEIQEDYSSSTSGCLRNATHAAVYAPQQAKLVAGSPAEEGSHSHDGNERSRDEQQLVIPFAPPIFARLFGADLHRAKLSEDQLLTDRILLTEGHTQHIGLSFLFQNVLQYMHIACSRIYEKAYTKVYEKAYTKKLTNFFRMPMCAHHKLIYLGVTGQNDHNHQARTMTGQNDHNYQAANAVPVLTAQANPSTLKRSYPQMFRPLLRNGLLPGQSMVFFMHSACSRKVVSITPLVLSTRHICMDMLIIIFANNFQKLMLAKAANNYGPTLASTTHAAYASLTSDIPSDASSLPVGNDELEEFQVSYAVVLYRAHLNCIACADRIDKDSPVRVLTISETPPLQDYIPSSTHFSCSLTLDVFSAGIENKWWDRVVLSWIFLNTIQLAMYNPFDIPALKPVSPTRDAMDTVGK